MHFLAKKEVMSTVVGEMLFHESNPRGEHQVYMDCAACFDSESLRDKYSKALKKIDCTLFVKLVKESPKSTPEGVEVDERSDENYAYGVYFLLDHDKGGLKSLLGDLLNLEEVEYVYGDCAGKTIEAQVVESCNLFTKFTDGSYQIIGGSNDGEIDYESGFTKADLELKFLNL